MNTKLARLLALQGRTVALTLTNGVSFGECRVVALPTRAAKLWVYTDRDDLVVDAHDVVDVVELDLRVAALSR